MTEAYTSYEAKVVGNGVAMLAGCAAFRTLVGAADATGAKGFILESWGGDHVINANGDGNTATACDGSTVDLSAAFGSVHCERVPAELIGVGVYSRSGEVQILIELPEPPPGETPGETMRRARNLGGALRHQMEAQLGGADAFAVASIDFDGATIADNPSEAGSSWGARSIEIVLTIRFTA